MVKATDQDAQQHIISNNVFIFTQTQFGQVEFNDISQIIGKLGSELSYQEIISRVEEEFASKLIVKPIDELMASTEQNYHQTI